MNRVDEPSALFYLPALHVVSLYALTIAAGAIDLNGTGNEHDRFFEEIDQSEV